jgi:hypothetical protein
MAFGCPAWRMVDFQMNEAPLGADRQRIRMLSDRLLFMRDQTRRDDLREHLRSEIHEARKLRQGRPRALPALPPAGGEAGHSLTD